MSSIIYGAGAGLVWWLINSFSREHESLLREPDKLASESWGAGAPRMPLFMVDRAKCGLDLPLPRK